MAHQWATRSYLVRGGIALAVGGVATTAVVGSAASFGTNGIKDSTVAAQTAPVTSCDTTGIGTSYATTYSSGDYVVTSVTVTGVDTGCAGKTLYVTLADGTRASLASASQVVPAAGGNLTLTPSSQARAQDVANVAVAIA